ncbi:hypothetical protein FBU30_004688 [Linnemannia zychae]|nr:hypothetical protein FBU30_004688 [Linnemannia zychae]
MLLRLHTLAFAAATVVYTSVSAQNIPPTADQVSDLIIKAAQSKNCDDCVAAVRISRDYARVNSTTAIELAIGLCPRVTKFPADVCIGYLNMQLPVIIQSSFKANFELGDDKVICHAVLGMCPSPPVTVKTLEFPRRKPRFPIAPTHSGKQVDVVHLSETYPTTNTTAPPRRAAATWGDYRCDTPVKLTQDLMKFIRKEIPKIDFAILTGDVPPHDTWLETKETVVPVEGRAYELMGTFLGKGVNVYPAIGNHEAGPTNLFPTEKSGGSIQWLYDSLSHQWSSWLSPRERASVRHNHGAYSTSPHRGFRIISLNTNFCYKDNLYLYSDLRDLDPNHEIHWLIQELQHAEDQHERVWIIGHVAPYQTDCLENWSDSYYQVVQRYSPHVIAEQFFGHSHTDEFSIYYGTQQQGNKTAENAIATAWTGPSVAPFTNINPGFRRYKVDTGSWNVFESFTYIANLDQAAVWDATGTTPNWHIEYSAREAYGAHVPIATNKPLSASWWHNVTVAFEADPANMTGPFQDFWKRRGKSSKLIPTCLGNTTCPAEMICMLRSARGADACIVPGSGFRKRDENDHEGGTKGNAERPWLQQMCGQFQL